MALEFLESFDKYGTTIANVDTVWTRAGGNWAINTTNGRTSSGRSLYGGTGGGQTMTRIFSSSRAAGTFGIAWERISSSGGTTYDLRDGATTHLQVTTSSGNVLLRRGDGTTFVTYAMPGFANATWFYFELQFVISDTVGYYAFYVNGILAGTASNVDTQNGGNATVDRVVLDGNQEQRFDDIYLCNTQSELLGPIHIEYQTASGAGTTTQFTPSASTNNTNIDDDGSDIDTTYNSDNVTTHKDTFAITNFSNTGTIAGVQVSALARLDDIGSRNMALVVRTNSTDYDSADVAVSSQTYNYKMAVWQNNPNTSAAWTSSDVNAMEAGYKLTS